MLTVRLKLSVKNSCSPVFGVLVRGKTSKLRQIQWKLAGDFCMCLFLFLDSSFCRLHLVLLYFFPFWLFIFCAQTRENAGNENDDNEESDILWPNLLINKAWNAFFRSSSQFCYLCFVRLPKHSFKAYNFWHALFWDPFTQAILTSYIFYFVVVVLSVVVDAIHTPVSTHTHTSFLSSLLTNT